MLGRASVGFRSLLASAFLVAFFGFGCLSPLSIRMNVLFGWLWLFLFRPAGLRSLFPAGGCESSSERSFMVSSYTPGTD